ncbi:MAG: hypothetical protein R6U96_10145, partial [Promethearchaeia archaeon]
MTQLDDNIHVFCENLKASINRETLDQKIDLRDIRSDSSEIGFRFSFEQDPHRRKGITTIPHFCIKVNENRTRFYIIMRFPWESEDCEEAQTFINKIKEPNPLMFKYIETNMEFLDWIRDNGYHLHQFDYQQFRHFNVSLRESSQSKK